jgi:hypothetical protein
MTLSHFLYKLTAHPLILLPFNDIYPVLLTVSLINDK